MESRHPSYKDCMAPSMVPCTPNRRRRSHSSCHCTLSYADFTKQRYRRLCFSITCCSTEMFDGWCCALACIHYVACLSGRSEALLLCVLDQVLNQDACIQPAERLAHCNVPRLGVQTCSQTRCLCYSFGYFNHDALEKGRSQTRALTEGVYGSLHP